MADNERTSIGFGGGEVAIINCPLEVAREALQMHLAANRLWKVPADYRNYNDLPIECAKAHEPGVYEDLVINPGQVVILQRITE